MILSTNPQQLIRLTMELRVQLTLTLNMLTLTLDVVDQLLGGVGRLHFAFVPFDWLLKWSSCSR